MGEEVKGWLTQMIHFRSLKVKLNCCIVLSTLREFQIPVTTSNIECFHSEQPCALQYLQDYPTALKSVKLGIQ